jgi:Chromo (CHRromatin Organisation MOdifier) domain/Chromo shadow domain
VLLQGSAEEVFVVEKVVGKRMEGGELQYLLKWEDYPSSDNTWEPASGLDCPKLVAKFEKRHAEKGKSGKQGKATGKRSTTRSAASTRASRSKRRRATASSSSNSSSSDEFTDEAVDSDDGGVLPSFENGDVPSTVIGAKLVTDSQGKKHLQLLIEWEGFSSGTFVPAVEAHTRIPQLVINFYESRLCVGESE